MDIPSTGGVWPPPPTMPQTLTVPFRTLFLFVKGSVPNFRVGTLTLTPQGLEIAGKAVIRYEIQMPILFFCVLLRIGWLLAYLIMEYAFRHDETLSVGWESVREVVSNTRRQQICFVYDAPNYKGKVKTFSLTTRVPQPQYEQLLAEAEARVPGRVREGKIRGWTSPKIWVGLGGLVLFLLIAAVYSALGGGSH